MFCFVWFSPPHSYTPLKTPLSGSTYAKEVKLFISRLIPYTYYIYLSEIPNPHYFWDNEHHNGACNKISSLLAYHIKTYSAIGDLFITYLKSYSCSVVSRESKPQRKKKITYHWKVGGFQGWRVRPDDACMSCNEAKVPQWFVKAFFNGF